MKKHSDQPLSVSVEQSKLLGNTLRVKILGVILETPKTSKQIATQIGETPGNVHYHLQRLYEGDLIELVEEKKVGGVIEKYYRSLSETFESKEVIYPELEQDFHAASETKMSIALQLKEEDKEELLEEFRSLMKKWVLKSSEAEYISEEEFVLGVNLVSRKEAANKKSND